MENGYTNRFEMDVNEYLSLKEKKTTDPVIANTQFVSLQTLNVWKKRKGLTEKPRCFELTIEEYYREKDEGKTDKQIAEDRGFKTSAVTRKKREWGIVRKKKEPKKKEYAVYKNDELVVVGTAKECAERMGFKHVKSVYRYGTPSYLKEREKHNRSIVVIKLNEDDEE